MKKLLSVVFIAILLLTTMPSVVSAPAKAAAKMLKITWNYNGGKIGKDIKTTTIIKAGAKIGKLPKTPTYTGYTFKGWYTKKTGGAKVTISTKPAIDVTYFAQWKNESATPTPTVKPTPTPNVNIDQRLIGKWYTTELDINSKLKFIYYYFESNGTFYVMDTSMFSGQYTTSGGKVYLTKFHYINADNSIGPYRDDKIVEYSIGKDNLGDFLTIGNIRVEGNYAADRPNIKFRREVE